MKRITVLITTIMLISVGLISQERNPKKTDTGPSWVDAKASAIGFSSRRTGHFNLYKKDLLSGQVFQITSDTIDQHYPVWSPDGQWMAYQTKIGNNQEIFVRNTKTGKDINVSDHPGRDGDDFPAWSPDSKAVYFSSNRNGNRDIFKKVLDKEGVIQVTSDQVMEMNPQVSPDGQWLAFASGDRMKVDIYVMKLDGSKPLKVTKSDAQCIFPTWHPNGKTLFFQKRTSFRQSDIFSIDIDSTNETKLTDGEGLKFYPRASADGTKILFMSAADGDEDIYSLNVNTGKITQLTNEEN